MEVLKLTGGVCLKSNLPIEDLGEIISREVLGGGIYYRIVDVGETVGNSALKFGGDPTSYVKVFTDVKGVFINAFPVPKP